MSESTLSDEVLAAVVREHAGSILAVLMAQFLDFDLAEDALQDAIGEALTGWRRDGPPHNGPGWLLTTARRRAIDRIRRSVAARAESMQREVLAQWQEGDPPDEETQAIPDERLRLIFMCCHTALKPEARVCLTLRTLCGLTTSEIARAFLVSEATMTKRVARAKAKIRTAKLPYEVPEGDELRQRFDSVLEVIYLIFNEGFAASSGGAPTRGDLCREAIRLGGIVHNLMPQPESGGLLALMLLHDARRNARADSAGDYVPIDAQDRRRWNHEQIGKGTTLLRECLLQERPGVYQVQAAISALHCEAARPEATDWEQIVALYAVLSRMAPSPVVTLNQAVAMANAGDLAAGLDLLGTVATALETYQPLHAARADLLRRAGELTHAANAYRKAISLAQNTTERRFLERQLARVRDQSEP